MQKTCFAPFLLGGLLAVTSSPAIAQPYPAPNDACSLTTASGQTVNLDALCQGRWQPTRQRSSQHSTAPVSFSNIRFGMAKLEGQITNHTDQPIHASTVRYEIVHNQNGRMVTVISGSARSASPMIEPGQTASFSDTFDQTQTQVLQGYFLNGLQGRFSYQDYTSNQLTMTNDPRLNTPSSP